MISLRYVCIIPFEDRHYVFLRNSNSDTLFPIELGSPQTFAVPLSKTDLFSFFTTFTESLSAVGAHIPSVIILPDEDGTFIANLTVESATGVSRIYSRVLLSLGLAIQENIPILTSEKILARAAQRQNEIFSKILMSLPSLEPQTFTTRDFLRMIARHMRTSPLPPSLADTIREYLAGSSHLSPDEQEEGFPQRKPYARGEKSKKEEIEKLIASLSPVNEKPM